MSQLTNIPLQDNYKSTLSQAWDGNVWTIYVNTVPSFTFPSWVKTYICVDPWKTNMQVARISAYDAILKTITVDNITADKGNGVAYTAQTHTVWSVIEISDNYQFREDLATAIDSKVDTNSNDIVIGKFADVTARNAYFTSPVEWNSAYVTWVWRTDYISWSRQTRSTTVASSTTQLGSIELSTQTETEDQTATWWSWPLVPTNITINPNNVTSTAPATGDKISFSDISNGNKLRSTTLQTAVDTVRPLASDAEAQTGTWTTQSVTPLQLMNFAWPAPTAWTVNNAFATVGSMTTTSSTPVKKSEATVTRSWTYRITFSSNNWSWNRYTQIYKNWSPFWTPRDGIYWYTYSEDLAFVKGDLLQLYMYATWWTNTTTNYSVQYNNYIMTNTTY